jgi:hypothetical protein
MKTISTIAALALLSASATVFAGEDSTDRWGETGTGPSFWATECGLEGFPGPTADKPCTMNGKHYQTSDTGMVPTPAPNAATGSNAGNRQDRSKGFAGAREKHQQQQQ